MIEQVAKLIEEEDFDGLISIDGKFACDENSSPKETTLWRKLQESALDENLEEVKAIWAMWMKAHNKSTFKEAFA